VGIGLDIAVIGSGVMGGNHARVLSSINKCNLVGVVDTSRERADALAKRVGTKAYYDYRQLIGKVDGVVVAIPTDLHAKVACDFLDSGVGVLIEKPIAATLKEAARILASSRDANVPLMVGHIERFNPIVGELKKILRNADVLQVEVKRCSPPPKRRMGSNVVLDLMIHDIDVLNYVFESMPEPAWAAGGASISREFEDWCVAFCKLGGVNCLLSANTITQKKIRTISVTCNDAYIQADYIDQSIDIYRNYVPAFVEGKQGIEYKQEYSLDKVGIRRQEPLRLELETFIDCLHGGEPVANGEDGLANLKVSLAISELIRRKD